MLDTLALRAARALLEWQIELGATEAIGDRPVARWQEPEPSREAPPQRVRAPARADDPGHRSGLHPGHEAGAGTAMVGDPVPHEAAVAAAEVAARSADTLEALAAAMAAYPFCELRKGARSTVFADGRPGARVMIVGEAPGREEDIAGRPFVGAAGRLLDRMFAAIGLSRTAPDAERALYITNVLPWRPPSNREPDPGEIATMLPFLGRHVALADPEVLVLLGNTPCLALLGRRGVTRLRGTWAEALGRPVLPMCHPAYLLRTPEAKREAWADLLALEARLG